MFDATEIAVRAKPIVEDCVARVAAGVAGDQLEAGGPDVGGEVVLEEVP